MSKANPHARSSERKLSVVSGLSVVAGNMVGTGIFTTTGLLLARLQEPVAVLVLWIIGGLMALCGALTYAELGVAMPQSGGEYHYLSRLYHPLAGFLSGWISLIAGFSAPIAAVGIAFAEYAQKVIPEFPLVPGAIASVTLIGSLHLWHVRLGSKAHNLFTGLQVLLMVVLIGAGIYWVGANGSEPAFSTENFRWDVLLDPTFATGLVLVMYAYSGWNAAAYLGGELKNPGRNLPSALIGGTLIVTLLYAGLNYCYLALVPAAELSGKIEVAHYAGRAIFDETGSLIVTSLVALACLTSLSAMMMAGPRVYQRIGEDFVFFRWLGLRSPKGAPYWAILLQMLVAIILILTFTFETILTYVGFTLSLFAGLAVGGIFVLRGKKQNFQTVYKTWGFPVTPLIFLLVMGWMTVHALFTRPLAAFAGLGTLLAGTLIYWGIRR